MVSVFGDDSADATRQRVFAVAGVLASEDEWKRIDAAWLERTQGTPFHATDCDSDQKAYAGRPHHENKALYKDLTQILVNSQAYGHGAALDLASFREAYPEVPIDVCYYKAFFETVRRLSLFAKEVLKQPLTFTFDSRTESNYSAGLIYSVMVNDAASKPDGPELSPKISFASSIQQPRIQAGDLYAREVMKYLDNEVGPKPRTRKSWEALTATKRFGADFFVREYFTLMKEKTRLFEMGDPEFNRHTYLQWLQRTNQIDTTTNRYKFLFLVSTGKKAP